MKQALQWIANSLCLTILAGFAHTIAAAEVVPFDTQSLNPMTAVFGLPSPAIPDAQEPGRVQVLLQQEIANNFVQDNRGDEGLIVDGEVWRSSLKLSYAWSQHWQAALYLPYVAQKTGVLDNFIEDWHAWFGLTNGGRQYRPKNAIRYYYRDGNQVLLDQQNESSGLGDIRLSLTQSNTFGNLDSFLTAEAKLPTGDSDKLLGSGASDGSLALMLRNSHWLADWNLSLFGGGALAYLSAADLPLASRQHRWIWLTRFGGGWSPVPSLQLKAQLDHYTPIYHSQLATLSNPAAQLTTGLSWLTSTTQQLDFAISEDLSHTVSPDVTFLIGWHCRL